MAGNWIHIYVYILYPRKGGEKEREEWSYTDFPLTSERKRQTVHAVARIDVHFPKCAPTNSFRQEWTWFFQITRHPVRPITLL